MTWRARPLLTMFFPTRLASQSIWSPSVDANLRARANARFLKAAKARDYDSEEQWLDEPRLADFVGFRNLGTRRPQAAGWHCPEETPEEPRTASFPFGYGKSVPPQLVVRSNCRCRPGTSLRRSVPWGRGRALRSLSERATLSAYLLQCNAAKTRHQHRPPLSKMAHK